jgi:hypothetical protein
MIDILYILLISHGRSINFDVKYGCCFSNCARNFDIQSSSRPATSARRSGRKRTESVAFAEGMVTLNARKRRPNRTAPEPEPTPAQPELGITTATSATTSTSTTTTTTTANDELAGAPQPLPPPPPPQPSSTTTTTTRSNSLLHISYEVGEFAPAPIRCLRDL